MDGRAAPTAGGGGTAFLPRLARDRAGNTLAIMAIALIPLTALAGSGIDAARVYVVKSRLQQACDAGVLAGRKFMAETANNQLDANARQQARNFFNNNMRAGWMGTSAPVFDPVRTDDNRVAADARIVVPMTVMKMFGAADVTLSASCEARLDIADTDIMFVLDTTGSMACLPSDNDAACGSYLDTRRSVAYRRPGVATADVTAGYVGSIGYANPDQPGSRMAALRTAVVDFYDTMTAAKQATTRVRYAFVPYSSTVNAGASIRAMGSGYIVGGGGSGDTARYQSRYITGEYERSRTARDNTLGSTRCGVGFTPVRTPAAERTFRADGTATLSAQEWNGWRGRCEDITRTMGPVWTYTAVRHDVSGYINNASVANPTRFAAPDTRWLGCIEESDSSMSGSTSFDPNRPPPNLDPDLVPSGATRWVPMWPEVEYQRQYRYNWGWDTYTAPLYGDTTTSGDDAAIAPWMGDAGLLGGGHATCGKPVQRIADLSRDQVRGYVDAADFAPLGGTYHDTGMLWAMRMLSRRGVFAADNAAQPGRSLPNRVIVFLTDGQMAPSDTLYGMFGMEFWDRRVANGDNDNLKSYHNARFLALCERAAAEKIDVWTVALGTASTPELKRCASTPDQALATTSGAGLSDTFKRIARAVAMLRISK